jgi:hypothetical protein
VTNIYRALRRAWRAGISEWNRARYQQRKAFEKKYGGLPQ